MSSPDRSAAPRYYIFHIRVSRRVFDAAYRVWKFIFVPFEVKL